MKSPFKFACIILILLGNVSTTYGQKRPKDRLSNVDIANRRVITFASPSLSAGVIGPGQLEFATFNTLNTRDLERTTELDPIRARVDYFRSRTFSQVFQLQYGLSTQVRKTRRRYNRRAPGRINLGIDLYTYRSLTDNDLDSSPLKVFQGNNQSLRAGLSGLGPRVRWVPFKGLPELTIQNALIFPNPDSIKRQELNRENNLLLNQIGFYQI